MSKQYLRKTLPFLVAVALMLTAPTAFCHADTLWDILQRPQSVEAFRKPLLVPPPNGAPSATKGSQLKKQHDGIVGFFDSIRSGLGRMGKLLNSDVRITGTKRIGFHLENISGNSETYRNETYYGRRGFGGMYDQTDLTISGKLGGIINFETRLSNSLYGNPNDNRLSLNYSGKNFTIDAGDINAGIRGNSLLDFNRTLKGIQLSATVMRGLKLTTLMSETKAQTRTITIPGGNGPGPYYVYAGQIVDGSVKVRVNDREMTVIKDYTLDIYTGELRFTPGTIIGELDTIAVTFETYGYNQTPGTLMGYRADIDLLKGAKIGLAYITQTNKAGQGGLTSKTDQFYGYENPATPYTLEFPVEVTLIRDDKGQIIGATPVRPMTVTVGGLPQVYGQDYVVDPLVPNRVYFRQAIPSTTIVRITYFPATTNDTPGNRSVWGIDATVPLGKTGNIVAEMSTSRLDLSGRSVSGGAWQLRGDMNFLNNRLKWNWNLRNIGANFTAIESPGFRRNERGLTFGLDYQASPTLKLTANIDRSKRPSYDYSIFGGSFSTGFAQTVGQDDCKQTSFGAIWQLGKTGKLAFTHNDLSTRLYRGGHTAQLSDMLSFTYNFKSLSLDLGIGRNVNESRYLTNTSAGGTSGEPQVNQFATDSFLTRLNLKWRAGEKLNVTGVLAHSSIKSLDGRNTSAQDFQLATEYLPMKNMRLSLGYSVQNSGRYSLYTNTGSYYNNPLNGIGNTLGINNGINPGNQTPERSLRRQYMGSPLGTGGFGTGFGYNYFGGGYNAGLGNFGNYSGGFYSGTFSNYSFSSFGGNARTLNFTLSYQPWETLSLDFNWNSSSSMGDYQFNSHRNDMIFNIGYNQGDRLSLNTAFSLQNVKYIGSQGGTTSRMMYLNLRTRPIGKLVTNFSYQWMRTANSINTTNSANQAGNPIPTIPGSGFNFFGSGGTNLNAFGIRLEYPLWSISNLFFQYDNARSTGYFSSDQQTTQIGLDFNLTRNMRFTLGWRIQQNISRSSTGGDYSYRVGSLDADLSMHF